MTLAPCDSPFSDRVIVILGTVRSGTTWLARLFGAHPDIAAPNGESWIFNSLWDLWRNAHSPYGDGPGAYLERRQLAASFRRFSDSLFNAARERHAPGTAWFVEKTPGHLSRLPLMAATHPDAWYVHLVRDGRDVARSLMNTSWGNSEPGEAAAYWAYGLRGVVDHCWSLNRFRELRYEDLLADPVGQMREVLTWMGLDVDDDVEASLRERAVEEVSRFSATDPVGTGKWADLSPEALERISEEAGDFLTRFGYDDGTD